MNKVLARTRLSSIICVVALLLGCSQNARKADTVSSQPSTAPVDLLIDHPKPSFKFVAYSDMRYAEHTSYGIVIANREARQQIIDHVASENPEFLIIAGDLVFRGSDDGDWTYFARAIKPIRDRKIPIFPA